MLGDSNLLGRHRLLDYMQDYRFWLVDISFSAIPVFLPVLGFSAIDAPQLSVQTEEIKEGNWHFPRKVVTGGKVEPITLSRGAIFYDSDFWRWCAACVGGQVDLLGQSLGGSIRKRLLLIHFTGKRVVGVPVPGKAWVLHECLATGYKPASNFDASSSQVSIQQLTLEMEWFEEFGVMA